jgi:Protein of unknown function (DUF3828)
MKRFLAFVALAATTALSLPAQEEPAARANATPEESIRSFYKWYVTALIANRDPLQQRAKMKQFATERLLKEIDKKKKSADGLGSDYFLDAQDFDDQWAKKISVSNVDIQGTKAKAHVLLDASPEMRRKLALELVNEGGAWKIDKVKSRDGVD